MSAALQSLQLLLAQCRAGTVTPPARVHRVALTAVPKPTQPPPPPPPASEAVAAAPSPTAARFVDIGANLLDSMFAGSYRGKQAHEADLDAVLARAAACGVQHAIVTAGTLEESRLALELVRRQRAGGCPVRLHSTVGVHPTRCLDFLPEAERAERRLPLTPPRLGPHARSNGDGAERAERRLPHSHSRQSTWYAMQEHSWQAERAEIEAAMAAAAGGGGGGEETLAALEAEVLARPSVMAAIEAHAQALRRLLSQGREVNSPHISPCLPISPLSQGREAGLAAAKKEQPSCLIMLAR